MSAISDKAGRVAAYLPSGSDEAFQEALNERLSETPDRSAVPARPTILVSGGPRSGTTFLAQALAHALDVAWIDHLAARFYRAPVTGFRLSESVFGRDRASSFRSDHGRSMEPSDIHGFHYFWLDVLGLGGGDGPADRLFVDPGTRGVDPGPVAGHLAGLEMAAGRPFVFKGYYPSYAMAWFCRHVPRSVFVMIRREPLDQARSIMRARHASMRSVDDWWSMVPPEHADLQGRPAVEQVAGQVFGLRRFFADQMAGAGVRAITVSYESLVADPAGTIGAVRRRIAELTGQVVAETQRGPVVRGGGPSRPLDAAEDAALQAALERTAQWDRPWPAEVTP